MLVARVETKEEIDLLDQNETDVYLANDPILESNDPLMKNLNNCVGDQF